MPYAFLMFLHVGSMFGATALAVGPAALLFLIARSGDREATRRAFGYAPAVFRVGGVLYGLGILFGVLTALSGADDLTVHWLLAAYVLIASLIAVNFVFEAWTRRIRRSVSATADGAIGDLGAVARERSAEYSMAAMVILTLAIVFVMVVKPNLFV